MSSGRKLIELRNEYLSQCQDEFERIATHWTESPIEALAVGSLLCNGYRPLTMNEWFDWDDSRCPENVECHRVLGGDDRVCTIGIQATLRIGGYSFRTDMIAISAERTKEQARRDKSRDRAMVKDGWRVLRFTGSEVYANSFAVQEAIEELLDPELKELSK